MSCLIYLAETSFNLMSCITLVFGIKIPKKEGEKQFILICVTSLACLTEYFLNFAKQVEAKVNSIVM